MLNGACNISNYEYDCDFNFFLPNYDYSRLFIIIFIGISLILNVFIVYIICGNRRNRDFSLSGSLTLIILFVNFCHKVMYLFNWVIKNDNTEIELETDKSRKNVGALLFGNPSNFGKCKIQGMFLIFFSISQDILINIFCGFINSEVKEKKALFKILLFFAGFIFPGAVAVCFYGVELIGINEKFCHISKYTFNIDNTNNNIIEYNEEEYYGFYKAIIFFIRGINFIITLLYIIRAIKYIKNSDKKDKKRERLISSLSVVVIACLSLLIEIIFKILFFINSDFEETILMTIYLLLNSLDCILLPLAFSIKHYIFIYLCCCCLRNNILSNNNNDNDTSLKEIEIEDILPPNKKGLKELYDKQSK